MFVVCNRTHVCVRSSNTIHYSLSVRYNVLCGMVLQATLIPTCTCLFNKTWYAYEVQAALYHSIKGGITHSRTLASPGSPASKLASEHQRHYYRVALLRSRGCMPSLQSGSCTRESVTHDDSTAALLSMTCSINSRRSIWLHHCGSYYLRSSSAYRRILAVVVREQIHVSNLASP